MTALKLPERLQNHRGFARTFQPGKLTLGLIAPFKGYPVWGTDSFCTAPIRAELRANPCYINDAADCAYANDDVTFFKKTIKTYQIPSKS